jgi:hypothetical protein
VLVGLAVRLDAAPAADPLALARRYADVLTGDDEPDDDVRDPDDADASDSAATDRAGAAGTEDEAADGDAAGRATTGEEDAPGAGDGAIALLEAEQAPPDATTIEAARSAAAPAGSAEAYEAWMRRLRPSLWGRLDVGVSWRRRWTQPRYAPAQRHDELWLFATWRR